MVMHANNIFFNWVINQPLLKQSNFKLFSFNLCNLSFFNYWQSIPKSLEIVLRSFYIWKIQFRCTPFETIIVKNTTSNNNYCSYNNRQIKMFQYAPLVFQRSKNIFDDHSPWVHNRIIFLFIHIYESSNFL